MSKPVVTSGHKIRSAIRATGVAIIVIAGTWWGAGLRTNQDFEKVWIHTLPLSSPFSFLSLGTLRAGRGKNEKGKEREG